MPSICAAGRLNSGHEVDGRLGVVMGTREFDGDCRAVVTPLEENVERIQGFFARGWRFRTSGDYAAAQPKDAATPAHLRRECRDLLVILGDGRPRFFGDGQEHVDDL